uniref:Uncharacterized protein LOC114343657 n=1 Tax=Diabrotica virgifera virgifera TaxID=50390 RepID=A0A6P7GK51_DIAVI
MEVRYEDEDLDLSEPEIFALKKGLHVIVKYDDKYYPGIILKSDPEGAEVRTMVSAGINWKWPVKEDIIYYFKEVIICFIRNLMKKITEAIMLCQRWQNTYEYWWCPLLAHILSISHTSVSITNTFVQYFAKS